MSNINWDAFKGEFIKWTEPGQVVEGAVVALRVGQLKDKSYPELVLETAQGQRIVSASQAGLMRALAEDPPAIGEKVHIEYTGEGEAKPGQSPAKLFYYVRDRVGDAGPKSPGRGSGVSVEDMA